MDSRLRGNDGGGAATVLPAAPFPFILNFVEGWPARFFRFLEIILIRRRPSFNKFRMSGQQVQDERIYGFPSKREGR